MRSLPSFDAWRSRRIQDILLGLALKYLHDASLWSSRLDSVEIALLDTFAVSPQLYELIVDVVHRPPDYYQQKRTDNSYRISRRVKLMARSSSYSHYHSANVSTLCASPMYVSWQDGFVVGSIEK